MRLRNLILCGISSKDFHNGFMQSLKKYRSPKVDIYKMLYQSGLEGYYQE